jgi:hypothetical protein
MNKSEHDKTIKYINIFSDEINTNATLLDKIKKILKITNSIANSDKLIKYINDNIKNITKDQLYNINNLLRLSDPNKLGKGLTSFPRIELKLDYNKIKEFIDKFKDKIPFNISEESKNILLNIKTQIKKLSINKNDDERLKYISNITGIKNKLVINNRLISLQKKLITQGRSKILGKLFAKPANYESDYRDIKVFLEKYKNTNLSEKELLKIQEYLNKIKEKVTEIKLKDEISNLLKSEIFTKTTKDTKLTKYSGELTPLEYENNKFIELPDPTNNEIILKKDLFNYYNIIFSNKTKDFNKIIINNNIELFYDDFNIFSQFGNNSPYSEYEFLIGLDNMYSIETLIYNFIKDQVLTLVLTQLFQAVIPGPSMILFGIDITLTSMIPNIAMFNSILLKIYNKSLRELTKINTIEFCNKYLPFSGFGSFRSELYKEYHLLFIYKNKSEVINKNIELFFTFISQKSKDEENEYIKKCLYFIKYLDDYGNKSIKNIETKTEAGKGKIDNKRWDKYTKDVIDLISSASSSLGSTVKKHMPEKLAKLFGISGGARQEHSVLHTLKKNTEKNHFDNKKDTVNYKTWDGWKNEQIVNFRLNYQIEDNGKKYILYSGDISIKKIYDIVFPLINSRSKYSDNDFERLFFMEIPFFVNNDLLNKLATIIKVSSLSKSIFFSRYAIIDFLKDYLKSFLMLYMLSKFNINKLIKFYENNSKDDKIFLDDMFEYNLSKTVKGKYKKIFKSFSYYLDKKVIGKNNANLYQRYSDNLKEYNAKKNDLEYIKGRDKINYFAMLMKYSLLCIDHIITKFKMIIIEDQNGEVYGYNNKIEKKVEDFFMDLYLTKEKKKKLPTYETESKDFISPYIIKGSLVPKKIKQKKNVQKESEKKDFKAPNKIEDLQNPVFISIEQLWRSQ